MICRNLLLSISLLWASVAANWPRTQYETESFTTPHLQINRTGTEPTEDGYIFLGIISGNEDLKGPMILEDNGDLVWHGSSDFVGIYNFLAQNLSGAPVLTYWQGVLDVSHGYGSVYFLDEHYNQIHELCLPDDIRQYIRTPQPFPGNCLIDKHESLMATADTIVVTTYNATQTDLTAFGGPKDGWVYDALFFEIEVATNKVLFQWNSLKHVPLRKSNYVDENGNAIGGNAQNNPWDYFHINSVQKIDGGYLVNSRYTWSFYVLDDQGDVKHVVEGSHGGDFSFEDKSTFFSYQHNARLHGTSGDELSISIFNNDNFDSAPEVNTSCGYLFTLNPKTRTVKTDRTLRDDSQGLIYSVAEGNYQALNNGHVLLDYGQRPIFKEFDANNNVLYSAQYSTADGSEFHSYRAYRLPWQSTPDTLPKSVAKMSQTSQNTLTVYMSWNGATNVANWNIWAGTSPESMKLVARNVKRIGFETQHAIQHGDANTWTHVRVEALNSRGKSLRKSKVYQVNQ